MHSPAHAAAAAPSSESAELDGARAKVAELLDGAHARASAVAHGANERVRQRCVECAAHMALQHCGSNVREGFRPQLPCLAPPVDGAAELRRMKHRAEHAEATLKTYTSRRASSAAPTADQWGSPEPKGSVAQRIQNGSSVRACCRRARQRSHAPVRVAPGGGSACGVRLWQVAAQGSVSADEEARVLRIELKRVCDSGAC